MKKILCILTMAGALTMGSGALVTARAQTDAKTSQTKKGWSKKAKYATVGAAAGAATGVLVSKKNGKGAVIGGVLGAGSGYLYGRKKDKKDGRRSIDN